MGYQQELSVALTAARLAAKRIMEIYADFQAIPDAAASITTQADFESQEIILQCLHAAFASDALRAEEQTPTLAAAPWTGPRLWIVDPIDGTRGFAQKNGEFSIMIALSENGAAVVGVVLEPALGRITYAAKGEGCMQLDGESSTPIRCRVSSTAEMNRARLTQSRSKPGVVSRQVTILRPAEIIETHSAGVKLARVARGEADIYVNHYPNFRDWDICAGDILVTEAGGRVTGMKGQSIQYGRATADQRLGLIASNGLLHDLAVERLRDAF